MLQVEDGHIFIKEGEGTLREIGFCSVLVERETSSMKHFFSLNFSLDTQNSKTF
jgi:hypothetical protein